MTFYFYIKPESERSVESAREASACFASLGIDCVCDASNVSLFEGAGDISAAVKESFDTIVAVGGDGTMLGAAQLAIALDKPIFGINAGRVGFLCAFDASDIPTITLNDLNNLTHSRRALLEVCHSGRKAGIALNDVTVNKTDFSKTIEFELMYGNNNLGSLRADGLIISTPTGSTGYSLSAGGPITDPSMRAMIVTPICSHSLFSRSHVFAGDSPVRVIPARRFANTFYISVDGGEYVECSDGTEITVKLSKRTLKLLVSNKRNFYDVLFKEISGRRE
ncbi:MAG: NAD(+)/NADH kinase [Oscillospiraceae bacterium]